MTSFAFRRRFTPGVATLVFLAASSLLAFRAQAQQVPLAIDTPVIGISSYDPTIPTPEQVLGYEIGTRHTTPHELVAYFQAVAEVSDRVTISTHAISYENRPLIHAIVTTPENHSKLESIREGQQRVFQSPDDVTDDDLASMPVVVYQGYSVHGNEASGTEAAIVYLYHLAAGQGPAVTGALSNAVVILDPLLNPDGRDRFVDWVNGNRGGVHTTDPADREHDEPWPGGRTNHYLFDLNRDWLVMQHPESKGRMALYHDWRPHVLTDHHEMGGNSSFFFQPGIPASTNPNTSDENQALTARIATFHARYLDTIGASYFSGESYDDFYYGKGSAFPDVNGSVGILFEQGSSRSLETEVNDGTLHYAYTVRNQFMTSLSTLDAAVSMRSELLAHQRDFHQDALRRARAESAEGMLIDLTADRTRGQLLADVLDRHRIEIHALAEPVSVNGRTYGPGDAYVIPMVQPQYRLLRAATERTLVYRDSLFYDVSTWTLPLAFNVDMPEIRKLAASVVGPRVSPVLVDGGEILGTTARTGYILQWDRFMAPAALHELQQVGAETRVLMREATIHDGADSVPVPAGSVYISLFRRDGRDVADDIHAAVSRLAASHAVRFHRVSSELTSEGPDLGGPSVTRLESPSIAILAGSGVSSGQAGEAWHALTERFGIPASLLDPDRVSRTDLSRYSVMVVPGGSPDDATTSALASWVRGGGRLLVLAGATSWAVRNDLIDAEERSLDFDSLLAGYAYADLRAARGAQQIGGTILEMTLDTTHPLAFGIGNTLPAFHNNSELFSGTGPAGTLVGRYTDAPLLSGYISEERLADAPGAATVMVKRMGGGRVVVFANRLNFRAYWLGTQRLFMNAVMFAPAY